MSTSFSLQLFPSRSIGNLTSKRRGNRSHTRCLGAVVTTSAGWSGPELAIQSPLHLLNFCNLRIHIPESHKVRALERPFCHEVTWIPDWRPLTHESIKYHPDSEATISYSSCIGCLKGETPQREGVQLSVGLPLSANLLKPVVRMLKTWISRTRNASLQYLPRGLLRQNKETPTSHGAERSQHPTTGHSADTGYN